MLLVQGQTGTMLCICVYLHVLLFLGSGSHIDLIFFILFKFQILSFGMNRVIKILDQLGFGELFPPLSVSLNFLAEKIASYSRAIS